MKMIAICFNYIYYIYIYIYIYTYTYTYIIHIYIYVCVYVNNFAAIDLSYVTCYCHVTVTLSGTAVDVCSAQMSNEGAPRILHDSS